MRFGRLAIYLLVVLLLFSCAGGKGVKETKETSFGKKVLGTERIYLTEPLRNKYSEIIILDFSLEGTNIQKVNEKKHPDFKDTVKSLTTLVPDTVAEHLRQRGIFKSVVRANSVDNPSPRAVILKARFTSITSGNRALRFFVGFGAGSSTVGVDGELIDAVTGKVLARFIHNRHSPASMGNYKVVFNADGKNLGKDIARFIKKLY